MATYPLLFSPDGRDPETFTVPNGKVVYLVRAPAVAAGTATVQDLLSLENYVLQDGETVYRTSIQAGEKVSLVFIERSNNAIAMVNAEVISPRE